MNASVPLRLLFEAVEHVIEIELVSGERYRGKLIQVQADMNARLRSVTCHPVKGHVTHIDEIFLRGSQIRYIILPDALRNHPMFTPPPRVQRE